MINENDPELQRILAIYEGDIEYMIRRLPKLEYVAAVAKKCVFDVGGEFIMASSVQAYRDLLEALQDAEESK